MLVPARGSRGCEPQGSVPFWPSALAAMTGYSESSSPIFAAALQHGDRLAQKLFAGLPEQHAAGQALFT